MWKLRDLLSRLSDGATGILTALTKSADHPSGQETSFSCTEWWEASVGLGEADSRKLEHGCGMVHDGFPSFFGLLMGGGSCSNFLASAANLTKTSLKI